MSIILIIIGLQKCYFFKTQHCEIKETFLTKADIVDMWYQ